MVNCVTRASGIMAWAVKLWQLNDSVPTHFWKSWKVLDFSPYIQGLESTWKHGWCFKVLESELLGPRKSWNFLTLWCCNLWMQLLLEWWAFIHWNIA